MPTGLHISRRRLLKGAAIAIGLPPLEAMFDGKGIAYAAGVRPPQDAPAPPVAPETRFVPVVQRKWGCGEVLDPDRDRSRLPV